VPGSLPHAGEASVDAGSAPFAALQELISKKFNTSNYASQQSAQEAARRAAVRSVGGTKQALDNAIATRAANATSNYGAIANDLVPVDAGLQSLMARPSIQSAMGRASNIAREKQVPFMLGQPPAQEMTMSNVHTVKKALDDMIADPKQYGIDAAEKEALVKTKEGLLSWIAGKSPGYEAARQQFARESVPIDQMRVGQLLEQKLVTPLEASQRPAAFAQGMRDAEGTVRRAIGGPQKGLEDVLNQQQMRSLGGVQSDLQRAAEYKRLAGEGTGEARNLLGQAFAPVEPPGMLHRGVMIARAVLERIEGKATEKTLQQLAVDMQNPATVSALMKAATPKERPVLEAMIRQMNGITFGMPAAVHRQNSYGE
jgi:hypothetical protein